MKAIRVDRHGEPKVLQLQEVDLPEPARGEARVRIQAAGVNFIDIYQRRGSVPVSFTAGNEAAGIIESVGEGDSDFKPGDRVAYWGHLGSYAEASIVPLSSLISLPDDLSFEQGAAFPLQGMTAHYLVHEFVLPKPGITVLIHAAAGGMGLLLVQWFKHLGARVIGTVSTTEKARAAREAGADDVIIYTEQDFAAETQRLTAGRGAELIIDGVAKTTFGGNLEAATVRGHVVVYGAASGPAAPVSPNALMPRSISVSGARITNFLRTREELQRRAGDALKGIREGWLQLRIGRVFPLSEAQEAHRLLENRGSIGKIILVVSR